MVRKRLGSLKTKEVSYTLMLSSGSAFGFGVRLAPANEERLNGNWWRQMRTSASARGFWRSGTGGRIRLIDANKNKQTQQCRQT
jgi:hypothetical protein